MTTTSARRAGSLVILGLLVAAGLALANPADAGYTYEELQGTVVRVNDGDTMDIDMDGAGQVRVRLIGVNAFELGECNADTAKNYLAGLVTGKNVTLLAPVGLGPDRFNRMRRYVSVNGDDVGRLLIEAGMVWPVPKKWSNDATANMYRTKAEAADAAGIGIWDDASCYNGPNQSADIELRILRNPDGKDSSNPNKEWVKLVNRTSQDINLTGWGLRSSGFERYTFPAGTTLPANYYLKVHAGVGTDDAKHLYWGLDAPMYSNSHAEPVVLIDPDGDIRSWKMTPCVSNCSDPLQGKVELRVNYDAPGSDATNPNGEWVEIVNVSTGPINLVDYVLINDQHRFIPAGDATVEAGERMRVYIGSGSSSRLVKYWGKTKGILANSGDKVVLRNLDGLKLAQLEWPCDNCQSSLSNVNITFVNPDAPGTDNNNLDEEFAILRNDDNAPVLLDDWALSSGSNWFQFEPGTVLQPGDEFKLVTGTGPDTVEGNRMIVHWNRTVGTLPNSSGALELIGPNLGVADCFGWGGSTCDRPTNKAGIKVRLKANPNGTDTNNPNGENVRITNQNGSNLDLSGYWVTHRGYTYEIDEGTVLAPGDVLYVYAGTGSNSRLKQYWGTGGGILANTGGIVEVIDTTGSRAGWRTYTG